MVKQLLAVVIVLYVAGSVWADDTAARKVRVAIALSCDGHDCPKKKVRDALTEAAPKSKEVKVREALMPISTAPAPRETAPKPPAVKTVCGCEATGKCTCWEGQCGCAACGLGNGRLEVRPAGPFSTPTIGVTGAVRRSTSSSDFYRTAPMYTPAPFAVFRGVTRGC